MTRWFARPPKHRAIGYGNRWPKNSARERLCREIFDSLLHCAGSCAAISGRFVFGSNSAIPVARAGGEMRYKSNPKNPYPKESPAIFAPVKSGKIRGGTPSRISGAARMSFDAAEMKTASAECTSWRLERRALPRRRFGAASQFYNARSSLDHLGARLE